MILITYCVVVVVVVTMIEIDDVETMIFVAAILIVTAVDAFAGVLFETRQTIPTLVVELIVIVVVATAARVFESHRRRR